MYPALSYSAFRKLLRKRDIKVDGARVGEDCTVGPGSVVQVYYDARPPVPVLFEDENLLVADKPRGIVAEEIAALFREEGKEIIPVHRLDRNTRGILLFAKNAAAEKALTDGFRARAFEKYYRAPGIRRSGEAARLPDGVSREGRCPGIRQNLRRKGARAARRSAPNTSWSGTTGTGHPPFWCVFIRERRTRSARIWRISGTLSWGTESTARRKSTAGTGKNRRRLRQCGWCCTSRPIPRCLNMKERSLNCKCRRMR